LVAWSAPYRIMPGQSEVNARERELVIDLREALPPTGNPSPAELQALRQTAARLRVINGQFYRASQLILARSQAVGAPVPEPIRRDLLNQAHAIYGDCIRPPEPNAKPIAQSLTANLQSVPVRFGS